MHACAYLSNCTGSPRIAHLRTVAARVAIKHLVLYCGFVYGDVYIAIPSGVLASVAATF